MRKSSSVHRVAHGWFYEVKTTLRVSQPCLSCLLIWCKSHDMNTLTPKEHAKSLPILNCTVVAMEVNIWLESLSVVKLCNGPASWRWLKSSK